MVGLRLNEAKSKLEPGQDIQFLGLRLHLDQGRASLPISKAREIIAHACRISSQKILSYTKVSGFMGSLIWASGLIPLGHLHYFEVPTMTFSFISPDKPVYTTVLIRPFSPCHPTQAMAGPIVSHVRNPYPPFPGGVHDFHRRLYPELGCPHGGFPDCGSFDPFRTQALHQCAGAQGCNIGPPTLGCSITGSLCYDR